MVLTDYFWIHISGSTYFLFLFLTDSWLTGFGLFNS